MNKFKFSFLIIALGFGQIAFSQCSELFFSEYIEGSSNNKALEIYNPTSSPIDLSNYEVYRNSNGSATPSATFAPQGILGPDSVYVIANSSANAAIIAASDTTSSIATFNGDDAVYLVQTVSGDTLDIIGEIGVDPGSSWSVSTGATANFTLIRKATIFSGQKDWLVGATEWDVFPTDMVDSLGGHSKNPCPTVTSVNLKITEIMYNPAATADTMEYIEFYNEGSSSIDLTGYTISQGINYTFPSATVNAGEYVLVARDSAALSARYGATAFQWASGDNLSNSGEQLVLKDNSGVTLDSVDYDDGSPWPTGIPSPDGDGPSIELVNISSDNSVGSNWAVSTTAIAGVFENGNQVYGTPGAAYIPAPLANIVITEIMYNPAATADTMEYIELFNNGTSSIDLNGFTITEGINYTFKPFTLNAGEFVVVARDSAALNTVYGATAFQWTSGDNLSNTAEAIVLRDNVGNVLDSVSYDDGSPWPVGPPSPDGDGPSIELLDVNSDNNIATNWSVSPTPISGVIENGKQVYGTPGSAFALPPIANLVITEINYNDVGVDTTEFVEFVNAGSSAVQLNNYSFSEGVTHTFGINDSVASGQYFVICLDSVSFRNRFGFSADAQWSSGALTNSGEDITIVDNFGRTIDSVDYDDGAPWPTAADGSGPSLVLCDSTSDNNDGSNWSAAGATMYNGIAIFANPGSKAPCTAPLVVSTALDSNVTCNGFSNGGASVTITSGNMPYTFSWSNMATTASISGVVAGKYFVTVSDNAGLTAVDSITITEPIALSVTAVVDSNTTCNGFVDGGASVTVSGGTSPYTYLWSNSATTASITGVSAGTYSVTITDANGCTSTISSTITEPAALVSSAVIDSNVTTNGGTNGGATASAVGGTMPYTYLWSNSATTASITGVGAGSYFVTITDANGCFDSSSVVITQPATIVVTVTNDSNVTCNGSTDGGASVTATGGIMPYTYLWSNSATTASITGVGAATYAVTVTDNVGSVANGSVTILEPAALVASVVADSNVTVNGGSNGGATASATGGTSPYTYLWSNSATTDSISGVMAGNYFVTVTDANGCTDTSSVNITQPAAMMLSGVVTNVSCNGGNDGSIDLSVMNGSMPYSYLWSNGDTIQDIDTLIAGTYSVTVTDANMVTATASYTVTEPVAISITIAVDSNVSCNGGADGGLTATATGGTGNLSYQWSAGNRSLAAQSFESTANDNWSFTNNPATYNTEGDSIVAGSDDVWAVIEEFTGNIDTASNGQYFWGVQDIDNANGGGSFYHTLTFNPINISNDTGVKFAFDYYSVGFDTSDSIEYQVQFNNGTNWDSNGVALNKNTQAWATVTVDVPDTANFIRVRLQAKQNGASDYGAFDNIRLFTGSSSITGVGAGSYTVTVTDSLGCTSIASGTITEPAVLTSSLVATDATTVGGTDGYITAAVAGGTPGYTYAWSNMSMTDSIGGLSAGTYILTVTDANGCTLVDSATVSDPAVVVLVMDSSNVSCFGAADGTAKVTASGGAGSYTYLWSNTATTDSIGGLSAGTYIVTVSDAIGTIAVDSVTINEPAALQLSFIVTNASAAGVADGAIDLTVNGGTPGYIYNWSNSSTTEDLTGLAAGTYVVIVNDTNGCQITDSTQVLEPGILANLVITEINYNGPESGTDTSEFIEIANAGSTTVNLNGFFFSQGVTHTFGANDSIIAGQYYVIAFDSSAFRNTYGINADAIWTSGGLSNGGEDITLVDNFGRTVDSVDFDDSTPWPVNSTTLGPDGNGASIELQTALNSDNNDGANWVASALAVPGVVVNGFQVFGSPGNPNATGINTVSTDQSELKIYPNPTKGLITIERENDSAERIQIISIDGKVLNDIQSTQKATIVDLSNFSNGVYFLRIGNETQRIVLAR